MKANAQAINYGVIFDNQFVKHFNQIIGGCHWNYINDRSIIEVVMKFRLAALALSLSALAVAQDTTLGKPLTLANPVTLATLYAAPAAQVGKTVQVSGKVTEVCEMMGCWMNLTDAEGHLLRIKVNDGDIVFPKDSIGKNAIAEGTLEKLEQTKEQVIAAAKHEAEEQKRAFDPSKIKSGKTTYQIAGTGAVISAK